MLREDQDAYGRSLVDHLEGEEGYEIIERDDGLIDARPLLVYLDPFPEWPPYERRAMRYVQGRVLDVGVGAGRCALYLQSRGQEVVGIDNSPLAVEVARGRGVVDARVLPFSRVSRRALGLFDTVTMMGNNFGLFASAERAHRLLRRLARMTSADGRIVASVIDPYDTTDPVHLSYHERNRRRGRMSGQLRLRIRHKTLKTPWFDYLFVSHQEMRQIVEGTGWRVSYTIDGDGPAYAAVIEKDA
jgi:SAM-dependent methyltransferase